ncbi:TraB/GumN family protein [Stenotrophomonas sp.]|uniref:TraB/GumN family protein n=1 Tax=Stenotrophomonas sp. TaxID=69392 RepID=UPI0028A8EF11|nr:TraB/GumN family protein [Stenotrophomonas sp.]
MGVMLAWLAFALPVQAQAPQALPEVVDLAPVVVSGVQPGPGMWRVTSADGHTLWILGTVSPLPAKLDWRADEVKAVIASADAVLGSPGWTLDADVGFFRGLTLLPSAMKAAHDPQGRRLDQILPPELYARWAPMKQRYLGRDRGVEKDRPLVAATRLYGAALKAVGLAPRSGVGELLEKAYKARGLKPVETRLVIKVADPRAALKEVRGSTLPDVDCLQRTLDVVEHQLPVLVDRANAWAVGDIEALQQLALKNQYDACVGALASSELGRRRGLTDLEARSADTWLAAARDALARHPVTFATVPVHALVAPSGYLERLRQAGYTIQAP